MDPSESLIRQVIELSEEVHSDTIMMEHLVVEFNQTLDRIRKLKAEIKYGTVHPLAESPVLQIVDDGQGFKLRRKKDFLERSFNLVARRL